MSCRDARAGEPPSSALLRDLARAIAGRAEKRMADAAATVPGSQAIQLRGAGLALQDVAAVLSELADRLRPGT